MTTVAIIVLVLGLAIGVCAIVFGISYLLNELLP